MIIGSHHSRDAEIRLLYVSQPDRYDYLELTHLEMEGWGNKCVSLAGVWGLARQDCPAGTWCGHGDSYSCDAASEVTPHFLYNFLFPANMAAAEEGQFLKQATGRNTRGLLRVVILCLIAGAAVSSRLFSVIRFESIIHECQYTQSFELCNWLTSVYSRPVVQLPSNEIPCTEWLLQLLGLVR